MADRKSPKHHTTHQHLFKVDLNKGAVVNGSDTEKGASKHFCSTKKHWKLVGLKSLLLQ